MEYYESLDDKCCHFELPSWPGFTYFSLEGGGVPSKEAARAVVLCQAQLSPAGKFAIVDRNQLHL